jgi:BolA protein
MHKNIQLIRERLEIVLEPQTLTIKDDSAKHAGHAGALESGGGHYTVHIVSSKFQDLPAIKRHKMVYVALGDAMGSAIHAISIKAQTPAEAATP